MQKPEQVELHSCFIGKVLSSQIDQLLSCSTYAKVDPCESKFLISDQFQEKWRKKITVRDGFIGVALKGSNFVNDSEADFIRKVSGDTAGIY